MSVTELRSAVSSEFRNMAMDGLRKNKELHILHRPSGTAGTKEWYLVHQPEEFSRVIQSGKFRSSFSIFLTHELPLRGVADSAMQEQANRLLLEYGEVLCVQLQRDQALLDVIWASDDPLDLQEFFEEWGGHEVSVGRYPPFWSTNSAEIITAYSPDKDGVVRAGAY